MNKSRITYRFDSQGNLQDRVENKQDMKVIPLYKEEYSVDHDPSSEKRSEAVRDNHAFRDNQMLNQYTYDYGAWNSPFDLETSKLEQLIRDTEEQGGNPGGMQHYDTSDEEYARSYRDEPRYYRSPGKSTGTPILKLFTSVSAAILTGALFGFFALSMFDGGSDTIGSLTKDLLGAAAISQNGSGNFPAAKQQTDIASGESGDLAGETNDGLEPVSAAVGLNVPAQTFYVLQNGVFNSAQGAETAMKALSEKGLAAAAEESESFAVFAGVSTDRDDALLLSHQLQELELEVYIKPYELPAVNQILGDKALSSAAQSYFSEGRKLAKLVADLTMIHLGEQNPAALDAATLQSVRKSHQSWSGYGASVAKGISSEAKSDTEKMAQAMNTAVVTMEEYTKNPSTAYLWNAQSAVMQYLVVEKHLLSLIAQ